MAPRIVEIILTGNATQALAEVEKLAAVSETSATRIGGSFQKLGRVATLGLVASAAAIGVFSIKAADDFEASHARLENAIKNTGGNFEALSGQIDKAKRSGEALGFNNTDVEGGLARLELATKNMGKSTRDLSIAEDIAAARHISLEAATDMLVKVEGGRYIALSKTLGVSKEVIDSFKTQEDAVRFLAEKFQGSAAAAAETFQGKIKVLVAQMEDLGVKIGLVLIPIIEGLGSALVAGVTFFEQHRAAAVALGIAVAGPLVASMLTYIGSAAAAFATTGALGTALSGLTTIALAVAGALQTFAVDVGVSMAVATGGLLLVAAALGAFVLLVATGDGPFEKMTAAGDKWAKSTIAQAVALGSNEKTLVSLQATHRLLAAQIRETDDAQKRLEPGTKAYIEAGGIASKASFDQATNLVKLRREYDDIGGAIQKLKEEHRQAALAGKALEISLGFEIPNAANMTKQELKALGEEVPKFAASLGDFGTAAAATLVSLGYTTDGLKALMKTGDEFAKSFEGSIKQATDPFAHFGDQAVVSEAEFEKFFIQSRLAAVAWAQEIQDLINKGVDQGIVMEMAAAGPKSKPALDAFSAMVDEHGVVWVNTVANAGKDVVDATETAFRAMVVSAAIHTAEQATIVKATTADMAAGGTANLQRLFTSTDANLRAIAFSVAWNMTAARDSAAAPIVISAVDRASSVVQGVLALIRSVPAEVQAHVDPFAGSFGLLPFRAAGGPVAAGQAYIVGERGPEMFVPGRSGTIIPNGAGGSGTIVIPVSIGSGRALAEIVVSELNRAGGPKVSSRAVR